ncbi:jg11275 [Pararge aegeria aegeria]|uniref:Jg11275 protein n=1 Tax=Pararge aegeria aegeria TaxID=348720 RepID=A0A8S4RJE8_9NEOP|nr:jg11275 [Pararge aegeria aegeria]
MDPLLDTSASRGWSIAGIHTLHLLGALVSSAYESLDNSGVHLGYAQDQNNVVTDPALHMRVSYDFDFDHQLRSHPPAQRGDYG